jgi:large subunit ribosomal protein L31
MNSYTTPRWRHRWKTISWGTGFHFEVSTNIYIFAIRFENGNSENTQTMKKEIHPKNYRLVAFRDMSNGHTFITKSAAPSRETVKLEDGNEYPLIKLEISSTSHPFYTGKMKLVDTAGRVDKFMNRYKSHLDKKKK